MKNDQTLLNQTKDNSSSIVFLNKL